MTQVGSSRKGKAAHSSKESAPATDAETQSDDPSSSALDEDTAEPMEVAPEAGAADAEPKEADPVHDTAVPAAEVIFSTCVTYDTRNLDTGLEHT